MRIHLQQVAILLCLAVAAPLGAAPADEPVLAWDGQFRGEGEAELRWPALVAAAAEGEIAVAELREPRLIVLREAQGEWSAARVVRLPGPPCGLAAFPDRYLVALRGGEALLSVDRREWAARPLPLPPGTAAGALAPLAGGALLVLDLAGEQVLRLSASGAVQARIPVPGGIVALAGTAGGGFYAALPERGLVLRFGADGRQEASWPVPPVPPVPAWPTGLAAGGGGRLLVLDRHGGRVILLDTEGAAAGSGARRGWDTGLLLYPSSIALLPDGRLAVADQGNGRVQIFRFQVKGGRP